MSPLPPTSDELVNNVIDDKTLPPVKREGQKTQVIMPSTKWFIGMSFPLLPSKKLKQELGQLDKGKITDKQQKTYGDEAGFNKKVFLPELTNSFKKACNNNCCNLLLPVLQHNMQRLQFNLPLEEELPLKMRYGEFLDQSRYGMKMTQTTTGLVNSTYVGRVDVGEDGKVKVTFYLVGPTNSYLPNSKDGLEEDCPHFSLNEDQLRHNGITENFINQLKGGKIDTNNIKGDLTKLQQKMQKEMETKKGGDLSNSIVSMKEQVTLQYKTIVEWASENMLVVEKKIQEQEKDTATQSNFNPGLGQLKALKEDFAEIKKSGDEILLKLDTITAGTETQTEERKKEIMLEVVSLGGSVVKKTGEVTEKLDGLSAGNSLIKIEKKMVEESKQMFSFAKEAKKTIKEVLNFFIDTASSWFQKAKEWVKKERPAPKTMKEQGKKSPEPSGNEEQLPRSPGV